MLVCRLLDGPKKARCDAGEHGGADNAGVDAFDARSIGRPKTSARIWHQTAERAPPPA